MNWRRGGLLAECLLIFGGIPWLLIVWQLRGGFPFFPVLVAMLALTLLIGWLAPGVRFRQPDSTCPVRPILLRAAAAGVALLLLTALLWPELCFRLLRDRPRLWVMVVMLYPLLSVAPQEYLFRVFFNQRYCELFGTGHRMRLVNALVFAWAHAFMLNPVAPLLSLPAGWLLGDTWLKTRSLRAVCLEHALYGQLVFTIGLGWFFYNASPHVLSPLAP